jgi:hypothetical protein
MVRAKQLFEMAKQNGKSKKRAQPGFEPGACHMLLLRRRGNIPEATIIPLDHWAIKPIGFAKKISYLNIYDSQAFGDSARF